MAKAGVAQQCTKQEDQGSCRQCRKDNVECVWDETPDLRLRHYHQQHKRTLYKVLDTFRGSDAAETEALLTLIREGASEDDIEAHLDQTLSQGKASSSTPQESDETSNIHGVQPGPGRSLDLPPPGYPLLLHQLEELARSSAEVNARFSPSRGSPQHVDAERRQDAEDAYIGPGATRHFGNLPMSNALLANNFPEHIQSRQLQAISGSIQECLPVNLDPESRADRMSSAMVAFRDAARSMIAMGQPVEDVLSMKGLQLDLMFRDRLPSDPHNVSTWACEFSNTWTFLPLHIRLASVHYAGTFMRWLILPCPETYALMSKLMRPVNSQLFIPHTGDIDICHLPCIRATQLAHGGRWVDLISADSQRCNWIEGDHSFIEDRLLHGPNGSYTIKTLSAAFTTFIDDERNWTISASALKTFPDLIGKIAFHEDENS